MSFPDRAVLWLHIATAVFTIGPGTAAIMSTPRYIRKRNTVVVGYLYRITRIYAIASLLVLIFGVIITQLLHDFSKPWVSASITLYVVAAVLLVLIMRDQRKAISALAAAEATAVTTARSEDSADATADQESSADADTPVNPEDVAAATVTSDLHTAAVERGRIATMSGVTGLIWLAILVLMVWGGTT
jgi:Ca2+/Na+ antiporter